MKSLLLKYRYFIIWIIVVSLLLFIIIPGQEQYYLKSALSSVTTNCRIVYVVLWFLLCLAMLRWNYKKIRGVVDLTVAIFYSGLLFISFYFVAIPFIKGGYLVLNRAVSLKEENKTFVVTNMVGDSVTKLIYTPKEGNSKEWIDEKPIVAKAETLQLKTNDTFRVIFVKGLLGAYYIKH